MSDENMNQNPEQPIEAEPDEGTGLTRRSFIYVAMGGVGLAYAGAIGYPIFRYLDSSYEKSQAESAVTEVSLKDADQLAKGTAMVFRFGSKPSLLIHHNDDSWVALDAVCTHMGCTVEFDAAKAKIVCNCHGGQYDAKTGENISGPPPRPLTKYKTLVSKGSVKVSKA